MPRPHAFGCSRPIARVKSSLLPRNNTPHLVAYVCELFHVARAHPAAATRRNFALPFLAISITCRSGARFGTGCAPILLIMEKQRKGEVQCRRNRLDELKMEKTFAKSRQIPPPNSTPNSAEFSYFFPDSSVIMSIKKQARSTRE